MLLKSQKFFRAKIRVDASKSFMFAAESKCLRLTIGSVLLNEGSKKHVWTALSLSLYIEYMFFWFAL
jgi:hypothetical protein